MVTDLLATFLTASDQAATRAGDKKHIDQAYFDETARLIGLECEHIRKHVNLFDGVDMVHPLGGTSVVDVESFTESTSMYLPRIPTAEEAARMEYDGTHADDPDGDGESSPDVGVSVIYSRTHPQWQWMKAHERGLELLQQSMRESNTEPAEALEDTSDDITDLGAKNIHEDEHEDSMALEGDSSPTKTRKRKLEISSDTEPQLSTERNLPMSQPVQIAAVSVSPPAVRRSSTRKTRM
jgi:hypothetical protein